ncbi:bis-aminopropyl spermidine synthase family protein [Nocardiopsis ansamitocini]|uniref:Methyltransferase n=1 Tax=Nocardiopsis ansamitocini TaxID=1670832 RepID=A0A9W6UGS1_9ACTN|nr:bis-aminopropyl spermidine synthase family protein [Nocardiopsis ansamitocini]GLU45917.1 methyltransferase [Nocardiopsis ansamitocini]
MSERLQRPQPVESTMTDLSPALTALLAEQGVDATRAHRVLATLAGGGWFTPSELVRATTVAHRVTAAVLTALEGELDDDGHRIRLREPGRYAAFAARPGLADPVGHLLAPHREALARLERLVAQAPTARADLDHVAATAHTALRRAVFLATRFDLQGARLLCVGDHDLTSLALALVHPGVEAVVVDIDERMLRYIDTEATELGLNVRCYFADLRLGLPASLRSTADLVFTDPPYTPEGVELFVRRGLEGLARPKTARVLMAYGASETTPALVAKTQERLTRLNLATEALWPDFNRYLGAEAIGAASDLYVLRPTARTPTNPREPEGDARIYSQGANARESATAMDAEAATRVWADLAPDLYVGRWPRAALPEGARRAGLTAWFTAPVRARTAVLDLTGGHEALAERVILASGADVLRVVLAADAPQVRDAAGLNRLRAIVGGHHVLEVERGVPDERRALLTVRSADADRPVVGTPVETLLGEYLRRRAHGSIAAVLREGLTRLSADLGTPVNKKQARTLVARALPWLAGHTLLDLPLHRFPALDEAVAHLAGHVAAE